MIQPSPALATASAAESQKLMGTSPTSKESSVGAFKAPTSTQAPSAKPATTNLSINTSTGSVSEGTKKPVQIPDIPWSKPETLVKGSTKGEKAVITYVPDGDTAYFNDKSGSKVECRIDSIDTPETAHAGKPAQKYGAEAGNLLKEMILNKEVTVKIVKPANDTDNYGRATCQIEIEGKNIDKKMLSEGAAWVYSTFRGNKELMGLENEARKNKVGLWADPNPMNPATFRKLTNYGK